MTSKTYEIKTNNSVSLNPECSKIEFDICQEGKEKDILISQLKARIFELELHEKDYDVLNERYNQMKNEFATLNECKNQLECEKKLRDEEFNKYLSELQSDNENLQIGFNDKLSNNKNLFSQNNILGKQIELKDSEICDLTAKLNDLENQLNRNEDDRNNLQKIITGINDINKSQSFKITQLLEDNKTLNQICQDQEQNLKIGEQERDNLAGNIDNGIKNIQDMNSQIRAKVTNINDLQNQLNKLNSVNMQYQNNIKDCERQLDCLKNENDNLKNNIMKENSIRSDENQKNNQLSSILNDREHEINRLNKEIENINIMQQNATNTNNILQDENAKLRMHIMNLTQQNQNLINEIHNVIEDDEKMQAILNRKDRITSLLMSNRSTIDQSLNNLDEFINRGNRFVC